MTREELEGLDRDMLLARAEAEGVPFARSLTRGELIDELLRHAASTADDRSKGFFGQARELLASVVGRGLHLMQATESDRPSAAPPSRGPKADAVPTITLAKIYVGQGLTSQALGVLHAILESDPTRSDARSLLEQLDGPKAQAAPSKTARELPPTAAPRAPRVDVDVDSDSAHPSVAAVPSSDGDVVVAWRARPPSNGAGAFALRVVVVEPHWDGPIRNERWLDLPGATGETVLPRLAAVGVVRVALAIRTEKGTRQLAHSPLIEGASQDNTVSDINDIRVVETSGTRPPNDSERGDLTLLAAVARAGRHANRRHESSVVPGGAVASFATASATP